MTSTDLESRSPEARARTFAALGDRNRIEILDLLGIAEQCVCDLQQALEIAPNLLSYHLRVLREAGLVEGTRRGRWVDYRLAGDAQQIIAAGLPGILSRGVEA